MGEYMRNLPRVRATCRRGIHQDTDGVSHEYCQDARNVWAPDGRVVQRPGYVGTGVVWITVTSDGTGEVTLYEDVSAGTIIDTGVMNNAVARQSGVAGDRWYLGATTYDSTCIGMYVVPTTSDNVVYSKPEYWNGTQWQYLTVREGYLTLTATPGPGVADLYEISANPGHLNQRGAANRVYFMFPPPGDWALTTVTETSGPTDYSKYWVRFTLLEGPSDTAFDASTSIVSYTFAKSFSHQTSTADVRGAFVAQFASTKRYLFVLAQGTTVAGVTYDAYFSADTPGIDNATAYLVESAGTELQPASIAVVPQADEAFLAYGNTVRVFGSDGDTGAVINALVEERDLYVGSGAPFDTDVIIQLGAFPKANYILFHEGRLWAAGIEGEPFVVRWTGKQPYHKCWPALSWERVAEDDNSPISALFAHGDQTCVAKNDSIWLMRDKGLNALDLREYDAHAIVRGVGVVANASVKYIRGRSIFLAEDGVYAFDGTPSIQKLSDRIQDYMDRITPGSRHRAAALHWRTKGLYLLAVALDGSLTNSHVLVWDYVNDAWWVWSNIPAQHWMKDEGSNDLERVYFGDSVGRLYELGPGRTDHGTAIDAWFLTHELGDDNFDAKRARCVRLAGSNNQGNTTVELRPNAASDRASTATVDFSDYNETNRILQKRFRRPRFKSVADFFTVKIRNNVKVDVLEMSHIDLEYQRLGER